MVGIDVCDNDGNVKNNDWRAWWRMGIMSAYQRVAYINGVWRENIKISRMSLIMSSSVA